MGSILVLWGLRLFLGRDGAERRASVATAAATSTASATEAATGTATAMTVASATATATATETAVTAAATAKATLTAATPLQSRVHWARGRCTVSANFRESVLLWGTRPKPSGRYLYGEP